MTIKMINLEVIEGIAYSELWVNPRFIISMGPITDEDYDQGTIVYVQMGEGVNKYKSSLHIAALINALHGA